MSRVRALLFDMDGTLVNSERWWLAAETEVITSLGGQWTDDLGQRYIGQALSDTVADIIERTGVNLTPEELEERLVTTVRNRALTDGVEWRPGAYELLTEAYEAGVACALVTASYRDYVQVVVDAAGPGRFGAVITGDMPIAPKPDPAPYRAAAEALGVPISDCVIFEDSRPGVRAACESGALPVAVPFMVPLDDDDPRLVTIPTLAGVTLASLNDLAHRYWSNSGRGQYA